MEVALAMRDHVQRDCNDKGLSLPRIRAYPLPGIEGGLTCPVLEWEEGIGTDAIAFFDWNDGVCSTVMIFGTGKYKTAHRMWANAKIKWVVDNSDTLGKLLANVCGTLRVEGGIELAADVYEYATFVSS